MKKVTDFALVVSSFFHDYLPSIRNLSKNSIKAYRDTFRLLLVFFQTKYNMLPEKLSLKNITRDTMIQYLEWLQKDRNCSNTTRNMRLASLHSFCRYLQFKDPGMLQKSQEILSIPIKKTHKTIIQYLTVSQTKLLLEQPDTTNKKGRRDLVLMSVLYDTAARVQEICDLKVRDIRLESPSLIRLTGKGCKSRNVPILGNTVSLLKTYMNEFGLNQEGKQDMPLFFNQRFTALSRGGVTHILQKYSKNIKGLSKKITPHVLRHSKAMHLLQAGINILLIRDILGHVSIKTTEMYARIEIETKRKVLEEAYPDIIKSDLPDWNMDERLIDFLESL